VIGVDLSAQMLRRAKEKFPYVTVHQQSVQGLSFAEKFDAVLFLDVFEMIGPEDWPLVLNRLRSAVATGGLLYFTVPERPADDILDQSLLMSRQKGVPAVLGELAHGLSYEFFPTDDEISAWLGETTLVLRKSHTGDGCRHYLVVPEG
jgi:SAM-dependent methyltransferase